MNCLAVYLEFFGHNCCILSPLLNYLINICLVKSSFLTSYRLTYEENIVIEGTITIEFLKTKRTIFQQILTIFLDVKGCKRGILLVTRETFVFVKNKRKYK